MPQSAWRIYWNYGKILHVENTTYDSRSSLPAGIRNRDCRTKADSPGFLTSAVFHDGSAVLPHIDKIVIRKSIFCISVCTDLDIFLPFPFTCFVKRFRKKLLCKAARLFLLGLVFFVLGRCLLKTRYHRDRLNFIKRFISVCFLFPPWIYFVLFYYIYRQK